MSMVYLIRHGQASFGHDDYDRLSDLGVRQARILAGFLYDCGLKPNAVYSGNMRRQVATAQEVIDFFRDSGSPWPGLVRSSAFDEYDTNAIVAAMFPAMAAEDPSLADDLKRMFSSKDSFKRVFESAMLRWVHGFPVPETVETWEGLLSRVMEGISSIRRGHPRGSTVVVFTSGGPIAASLAGVLGISGEASMRLNWQIVNTSITRFMYNEERVTLAGFNVISHLELAGDPSLVTYR